LVLAAYERPREPKRREAAKALARSPTVTRLMISFGLSNLFIDDFPPVVLI
jgi:hypothetical protein